jgi:CBS domain-containing protein
MDIRYAIRLLVQFGLSRALVLEASEPAGIVTLRDMVLRYIPPGQQEAAET